jgi:ABC-type ATPase with predicted acetyltransferase domain
VKYILTKSFTSSVQRTPRVLEIAEGFGLGLTDKRFVIFDNLEVEVNQGDVVFITGQSGGGKSLALSLLTQIMENRDGLKIADLNKIELPNKPVIELVGKTTTEAADILAKAGISDAWIYIKTPNQLSDGQRYRLKLAMLMDTDADVWIADEFGAVLDRVTAKCVAFNMQKVARARGKTLMVATTHDDLTAELGPSLIITKRFREKVTLETRKTP